MAPAKGLPSRLTKPSTAVKPPASVRRIERFAPAVRLRLLPGIDLPRASPGPRSVMLETANARLRPKTLSVYLPGASSLNWVDPGGLAP